MGVTTYIGKRVELISMDPHFHEISIGLFQQEQRSAAVYLVHSYSPKEGTRERLDFLVRAMAILGGMEQAEGLLRFSCGNAHLLAARRIFLEACKLKPEGVPEQRPLQILDKKSGVEFVVRAKGEGAYEVVPGSGGDDATARAAAIANGLAKLAEMIRPEAAPESVAFACGQAHDAVVGLLLARALNVRAALREEEMAASRGVLVAPSAQK